MTKNGRVKQKNNADHVKFKRLVIVTLWVSDNQISLTNRSLSAHLIIF